MKKKDFEIIQNYIFFLTSQNEIWY